MSVYGDNDSYRYLCSDPHYADRLERVVRRPLDYDAWQQAIATLAAMKQDDAVSKASQAMERAYCERHDQHELIVQIPKIVEGEKPIYGVFVFIKFPEQAGDGTCVGAIAEPWFRAICDKKPKPA